ncbi:hypothetical protein [Enterococcus gallinarum]|uniref:Uncharacterized protein n=1 Tax=Enterococcus gallinarum TaxID=1353 RepID=A0ABD4ZWM0_ENTGA|nr:hypothetical protein [Enterococcus gallinarum]MCR1932074.1 hypothetical protein [Enterococcus gallinarum]MDL4876643.1 hypothetical protein [Enterococcus gallinarum]MDL4883029.1 hypothetical protein [Enterococcus gallinarum]MDL4886665.1 hypothetical protein [Enterococcus gallinarum]MDL4895304.1 hypothetical protein [Enterococcus gallinarum]
MYYRNLKKGEAFLQEVDIIGILLASAPVLIALIGLIEACVKLADTIINARSSKLKSKKKRKKNAKK